MSPAKKITLLLAERHGLVGEAMCALLEGDGVFRVAGQARTGRDAVKLARKLRPDVIVMDAAMPVVSGLEATRQILAADPRARVLILSAFNDREYKDRATAIGAAAFLEKQVSAATFTKTICRIAAQRASKGRSSSRRIAFGPAKLRPYSGILGSAGPRPTPRETEVLHLVAEGFSNKSAAMELGISVRTVEKHRQNLLGKLDIHSTAELTRYAIAASGILSVRPRHARRT